VSELVCIFVTGIFLISTMFAPVLTGKGFSLILKGMVYALWATKGFHFYNFLADVY